jgi:hypothetical protein
MEEMWSTLILPMSENHFMREPFIMLRGADLSGNHFVSGATTGSDLLSRSVFTRRFSWGFGLALFYFTGNPTSQALGADHRVDFGTGNFAGFSTRHNLWFNRRLDAFWGYDDSVPLARKEKIALVVSALSGAGIVFLLNYAGPGAMYLLFGFQFLVVPLIVGISERIYLVTWQVCILTSVVCLMLAIWRVGGGESGFELSKAAFVFWAMGTIISSPAPLRSLWLRTDKSRRVVFLTIAGVGLASLLILVRLVTR